MSDPPKIIGINRRYYPAQASFVGKPAFKVAPEIEAELGEFDWTDDPPATVCVLVLGEIGDYAAYIGHGNPEWVARHGNKICFQEAQVHFPGIENKNYRER